MILPTLALLVQAAPDGSRAILTMLWYLVAFAAIFYFLVHRPRAKQEREHRERLAQIKRGDQIVTTGGIIGDVVHIKDNQITIKSADSRLLVQRDRIAEVRAAKAAAEEQKA